MATDSSHRDQRTPSINEEREREALRPRVSVSKPAKRRRGVAAKKHRNDPSEQNKRIKRATDVKEEAVRVDSK